MTSTPPKTPARRAIDLGRRATIGALAAGAAGFVAFGPRGAKQSSGGKIVLDYWEKWTRQEADAMRTVVREFNASQNKIEVRYLTMAGIDQKTLIAIAGGNPPDIAGLWNHSIPLFAETRAVLPLDDLAPGASHRVKLDSYALALRPIMTHQGKMWGVVNTGGTLCLYYNRAIFREVGLDPDRPPRTISEFDDYQRRLTLRDSTRGGAIRRMGTLVTEPGWWSWVWGYHFGGTMWDEATERSTVAEKGFTAAFDWIQAGIREVGVEAGQKFQDSFGTYDAPDNAFLSGKLAMILQGPWLSNVIGAYKPDLDYATAPFPVADGLFDAAAPVGMVDTDVLVIPRGVRHPEASMEFVAYTQRPEVARFLALKHHKIYPLVDEPADFAASHPNRGIAAHQAIARSPRGFLAPRTRVWTQLKAEFDAGATRIRRLEGPASQILAEVEARSQQSLDRNAISRVRRGGAPKGGAA